MRVLGLCTVCNASVLDFSLCCGHTVSLGSRLRVGGGGLRAVQGFGFSAGDCPAHLRHSMVFRGRPVTRWLVTAVSVY